MAESEVKVLGVWASPFVMRPRIALNIKNVNYTYVEENMENKSELLLKSNPVHKKVPVLIHGDKAIAESLVTVEYIDEAWPSGPSILPSDPYDRAVARFWVAYVNEKVLTDSYLVFDSVVLYFVYLGSFVYPRLLILSLSCPWQEILVKIGTS